MKNYILKENCSNCWYWDKQDKSCANALGFNFAVKIPKPQIFNCMEYEPDYIKENQKCQKNTV